MKRAFKLGVMTPVTTDATSFYRAVHPLVALKKSMGDLELEFGKDVTWAYFAGMDAIFMQRPYLDNHVLIMKMAKANGVPVWVDYDDDLLSVPMHNPTHRMYNDPKIMANVTNMLVQADVVTVSTEQLRRRYLDVVEAVFRKTGTEVASDDSRLRLRPEKFLVCPNAYHDRLFGYSLRTWRQPPPQPNLCVMWRGSQTHDADLSDYTIPMGNAFERGGAGWTMNFVGSPFWGTLKHLEQNCGIESERIIVTPVLELIEMMHHFLAIRPALMQVPLHDDLFNRSKSNIAWIEATHAGAITLAPDWEEWRRPGVINYKNADDYYNKLLQVLKGNMPYQHLIQQSRDFIAENLLLSRVNRIREQAIEMLKQVDPWA